MQRRLAILLVSCTSPDIKMEELLQAWVGHDLREIVGTWGPPTFDTDLKDGEKVYTWRHTGSYTAPSGGPTSEIVYSTGNTANESADPTTFGGHTFTYWCDKSFTVNAEGIITSGSWRGNACH